MIAIATITPNEFAQARCVPNNCLYVLDVFTIKDENSILLLIVYLKTNRYIAKALEGMNMRRLNRIIGGDVSLI